MSNVKPFRFRNIFHCFYFVFKFCISREHSFSTPVEFSNPEKLSKWVFLKRKVIPSRSSLVNNATSPAPSPTVFNSERVIRDVQLKVRKSENFTKSAATPILTRSSSLTCSQLNIACIFEIKKVFTKEIDFHYNGTKRLTVFVGWSMVRLAEDTEISSQIFRRSF